MYNNKQQTLVVFLTVLCVAVITGEQNAQLHIRPLAESILLAEQRHALFTCIVTGVNQSSPVDLHWYHYTGQSIPEFQSTRVYTEQNGPLTLQLYISSIVPTDAGSYECKGAVNGKDMSKSIVLDVFKDITFEHAPVLQHPTIYTDALIECRVDGKPEPEVSFLKGGQHIVNNSRYVIRNDGLMIKNITTADNGIYVCRAVVPSTGSIRDQQITVDVYTPPGPPSAVSVKQHSSTTVIFTIVAPEDDGGMDVVGLRCMYEDHTIETHLESPLQTVIPGQEITPENKADILIWNLRSSTTYLFRFQARNAVGLGYPIEYAHRTEDMRAPYPIYIVSNREGTQPHQFTLSWETPRTGGVAIRSYIFKYRRMEVEVHGEEWRRVKPIDNRWTFYEVEDDPSRPRLSYTLTALTPNTYYEVEVIARNDIGDSVPESPPFLFRTAPSEHHTSSHGRY